MKEETSTPKQVDWAHFLRSCSESEMQVAEIARVIGCKPSRLVQLKNNPRRDPQHAIGNALIELHATKNLPFEITYLDDAPNERT